ncbi:MAG: Ribonucleoside-diphosphate reductase [candidate division WWE3 bacterium GW2011_GWF2_41_45]|uniref:Vitamin B12-dependent ribonucleotide reductase n=1 Tax=candidate division WWE3 bacterium GW2011_GWC2_41_23 TaxID=1619123 RepID=A0A0G0YRL8_UNCKA|nr:MAG: Ribonucleoside-diphosphate reductase [candidate division WWE3 bacterium GW2011_GWC2_41_23]KKS09581.1 MAG: Ribonucleoside-diphosphate reductase [candidate division WWE3 bacterium GW2011_GWF2_41_45]KKS11881.1 MAG: Ribonucleoside-diphosphate reductase [candidate division WWE3 bacterium GW2011_GWF1_41_53]KKS19673.1 MAG: Ribonucleoside-diphosphate reductase [candidate division WWE3 bacterium GW2011_GWE1_41_72]KKS30397.1 MAG: Ribonucleoside-diphosphate reductase [candidate division WWE3 bacte
MSSFLYREDASVFSKNTSIDFSENAKKILEKRYLRRDSNGNVSESPEGMFERIADVMAAPDRPYTDVERSRVEFYNLLSSKKFFPNSPTFTGAGTPLGQLAACFVLPISDDLGKEKDGIFSTLRVASLIQQSGGGNGFSFSRLRPKGSRVAASNGIATGPVGFLKVYDAAFGEIAQGGVRRGANMGVLRIDHPDIREFIECKSEEGKVANFNLSVAITDKFMEAVKNDTTYDLVDPHSLKITESPRAREIFDMIVDYAHKNGEPGVLFIDTANKENPVPHLYELEATNPCGEQWLGPYENCCLGSINLAEHLTSYGKLDWEELKKTVVSSTRFLDNVVEANRYIPAVPEIKDSAMDVRRIGLGFMALADAMYSLGIRYGSDEGQEFAAQVFEFIRYYSMKTSIELAKERGSFRKIQGSIYDPANLKWTPPKPIKEFTRNFGRPWIDWSSVVEGIKAYGIRNGAQATIAPTGTISTVAGVEGYGCEPVFALAYYRNVYQSAGTEGKMTLAYVSPFFQKALDNLNLSEEVRKTIIDKVIESGTCKNILELPESVRNTFVVSAEVTPEEHIMTQAAIQAFVDNSISKTCNFPEGATKEDVAKVYMMGWETGCKGLTVYVTGSRQEVVLETKSTKDQKEGKEAAEPVNKEILLTEKERSSDEVTIRRGYKLSGSTYKMITPQGKAFITINKNSEGRPLEVFLNVGKAGSDVAALAEGLGRLLSGWLRMPQYSLEVVREIIVQLAGIGGSKSIGFGKNRVSSLPDAVAKVLAEEFGFTVKENGTKASEETVESTEVTDNREEEKPALPHSFTNTDMCPECGNYTLVLEEGCAKCYECGYSRC